jgi:predicted GTPase
MKVMMIMMMVMMMMMVMTIVSVEQRTGWGVPFLMRKLVNCRKYP